MDPAVQAYVDAILPAHRPLFDHMHGLVLAAHPDVEVALSYGMPTYRLGKARLHVGAWKHGISLYGWRPEAAAPFLKRHPGLRASKGTVRLTPTDAASIRDDELRELIEAALNPPV